MSTMLTLEESHRQAKERNGLTSAVKGQNHGLISSVVMNSTSGDRPVTTPVMSPVISVEK